MNQPEDSAETTTSPVPSKRTRMIVAAAVAAATVVVALILLFALRDSGGDDDKVGAQSTTTTERGATTSTRADGSTTTTDDAGSTTTNGAATTTTAGGGGATTTTSRGGTATTSGSQPGQPTPDELWIAYRDAFTAQCNTMWAKGPDQKLYDPDDVASGYDISMCMDSLTDSFAPGGGSLADARDEGRTDALDFAGLSSISGLLCWKDPITDNLAGCWDTTDGSTTGAPPPGG